jgi:hypothetical protein
MNLLIMNLLIMNQLITQSTNQVINQSRLPSVALGVPPQPGGGERKPKVNQKGGDFGFRSGQIQSILLSTYEGKSRRNSAFLLQTSDAESMRNQFGAGLPKVGKSRCFDTNTRGRASMTRHTPPELDSRHHREAGISLNARRKSQARIQ